MNLLVIFIEYLVNRILSEIYLESISIERVVSKFLGIIKWFFPLHGYTIVLIQTQCKKRENM